MSLHQDIGASDCEKPKLHCEILTRHDANPCQANSAHLAVPVVPHWGFPTVTSKEVSLRHCREVVQEFLFPRW